MGLSASQGRLLLLTARRSDLEFRAQNIAQRRISLSQQLEAIATEYENATTNKHKVMRGYNSTTKQNETRNLTYSNLVSSALANGYSSGIIRSKVAGTLSDTNFSGANTMRLLDSKDRIVVTDPSEIPGYTSNSTSNVNQFAYSVEDGKTDMIANALNGGSTAYAAEGTGDYAGKSYLKIGDDFYGTDGQKIERYNGSDENPEYKAVAQLDFKTHSVDDEGVTSECFVGKVDNSTSNGEVSASVGLRWAGSSSNADIAPITTTKSSDGGYETYHVICGDKVVGDYIVMPELSSDTLQGSDINALQNMLEAGVLRLEQYIKGNNGDGPEQWQHVDYDVLITEENYTADDTEAEIKYKRKSQEIQTQDKKLELELSQIETQRSAVTTEIDSVKKVIDDNIQSTFKIFS